MIYKLSPEEVRVCTQLATERWLTKATSTDRPNYAYGKQRGYLEHELLANIRANISEWAVAAVYGLSWNLPWYPNQLHGHRKNIPDVGNLEVRTVRTRDSIPFWEKDKGRIICGTKVLDDEYYSTVKVYGRFNADDYMVEQYYDATISGWRLPITEIKEWDVKG